MISRDTTQILILKFRTKKKSKCFKSFNSLHITYVVIRNYNETKLLYHYLYTLFISIISFKQRVEL